MTQELFLSAAGLSRLPRGGYADDFTFDIGSAEYSCPCFIADFLSPRICALRCADPTVQSFWVRAGDPGSHFPAFLALARGSRLPVTPSSREFLSSVCCELRNLELYEQLFSAVGPDLTRASPVLRLHPSLLRRPVRPRTRPTLA
jgi:hypothetical protein